MKTHEVKHTCRMPFTENATSPPPVPNQMFYQNENKHICVSNVI